MDSSSHAQIQEVYKLSCIFNEIWNSIQQQITDENTIIVILLGSQNSGKTTFFKYLENYNENIFNKSKDMLNSNNLQYFDTFKIEQPKPHLFLDFHSTLNSEKNNMILIFEELFLRLIDKYEIKIIYILEHPENQLSHRGSQLQEFIQKYLGGNQINLQSLHIILNKYLENLNDEELKYTVKKEIQEIYATFNQEIFVFRKMKSIEQKQKEFSLEKRSKILYSIIKQHPLKLKRDQFTLNQKLVYIIENIFQRTPQSILNKIQEKNKKVSLSNENELEKLKKQYEIILHDSQSRDPQFLFDKSKEWAQLIEDNIKNDPEFIEYQYLKKILSYITNIIEKSKILEEVNRMVQYCFQVLIQNLESYIIEECNYKNNILRTNSVEINSNSREQQIYKYECLYNIQFEELSSIVNNDYVKQPCESTKKLKIVVDTLQEYKYNLEKLKKQVKISRQQQEQHNRDCQLI